MPIQEKTTPPELLFKVLFHAERKIRNENYLPYIARNIHPNYIAHALLVCRWSFRNSHLDIPIKEASR